MAEMQLTEQQQGQIGSLLEAVGQDAALRERFRADPRAILGEYGLAELVPSDVQLEVEVEEPDVGAYAARGGGVTPGVHLDSAHIDRHVDIGGPGHLDWAHSDVVFNRAGAAGIKIMPVFGANLR